jgi:hypothetical protein
MNPNHHPFVPCPQLEGWALLPICLLLASWPSAALAQSPLPDSFDPGADYIVNALAVSADGRILVGGQFNLLGGQQFNSIGQLNRDGTPDVTFNQ